MTTALPPNLGAPSNLAAATLATPETTPSIGAASLAAAAMPGAPAATPGTKESR